MTVLRSRRVLLHNRIEPADVVVEDGFITAVLPYEAAPEAMDLGRRLLLPGFIDLHSDAIEKEIEPRPGATFPMENAIVELDKKLAMAGITTMFHAIAFNEESLVGLRGPENAARLIECLHRADRELLAVDNFIHARFEITSFSSVVLLKDFMERDMIRMLSFMDHSPGQGQFGSVAQWKKFHMPVYDLHETEVTTILSRQREKRGLSSSYLEELADWAKRTGVLLASHDDDCHDKIEAMARLGVRICEFPLSGAAAKCARARDMITCMGAPNVVRGKSQSGNISARQLIDEGLCDFLCSDYHPGSMLQAVYAISGESGMDLAEAFAYVSATPAEAAGLEDRGAIAPGRLADLLVVEDAPVVRVVMTLKAGKPIYSSLGCLCTHEYA